jgi:hypothetical protein
MDPRISALQELSQALEELLAGLDEVPAGPSHALEGKWERCANAFARLESLHAAGDRGSIPPGDLRVAAQATLRLQAVAASSAARSKDAVAHELGRLAQARERLRAVRARGATGRACDVEG